ncbi:MAG: (2Fe-2S)-binding protein [Puniceicoccales bacterium]|jgi:NADH-quinone oxidoreductase subunit G|nr:(2Fe-2S)-binding protein [Puniceicoccales bacterium]
MDGSKVKVALNGKNFEFDGKIRLIDALTQAKIDLPSPCHHDYLSQICSCGLCLVGVKANKSSLWKIELACAITIEDGMEVNTEHPQAAKLRESIINIYLMKHPLDCSLCDKVGSCFLHKFVLYTNFHGFTRVTGRQYWRRNLRPLGGKIAIDDEKCILCDRCLRFCRDVLGEDILGRIKNDHNLDEINVYPGKSCANNYSLNLVDICPAGALIDQTCYYDKLAWDLQHTPSISPESSVGVNTYILHDGKHVHRIIPRRNDSINESWMPDSARDLVNILRADNRTTQVMRSGEKSDIRMMIAFVVDRIISHSEETYVLCSGETSLEDQFVLKRFLDIIPANLYFLKKQGVGDGFLISNETPIQIVPEPKSCSYARKLTRTAAWRSCTALLRMGCVKISFASMKIYSRKRSVAKFLMACRLLILAIKITKQRKLPTLFSLPKQFSNGPAHL